MFRCSLSVYYLLPICYLVPRTLAPGLHGGEKVCPKIWGSAVAADRWCLQDSGDTWKPFHSKIEMSHPTACCPQMNPF